MTTVWFALRADVRRRWPALLSLALLLGLIGGVVLTAAAGARRTDTAYPRLLTWANATQTDILPEGNGIPADYFAALARQPHIAAMTTAGVYGTVVSRGNQANVTVMSSPDGAMGVTVDRVKILAGRLYDPKAPGQAMVDQQLASLEHLTPGGTLRLYGVPSAPSGAPEYNKAVTLTYRVTAIVAFDDEIVPTGTNTAGPTALVSWPFAAPPVAAGLADGYEAAVRLAPGASLAAFTSAAEKLAKRYPDTTGNIITINLSDQVNATERAIRPEAVALAVFAGLAGLIALAVIGQLLSRQLALDAAEFPILRALGVNRAALVTLSLARLGIVTVTGAIVALAVAIAASPLMPIGPARLAEPHPGVEVNLAILGAGFAAIALLPLAVLTPPAWRAAHQAQGPLGVAEPIAQAVATVAARGGADPRRVRDRRRRGRDGVRAWPRQDRGPGPQRAGRQRHRGRRARGRRRLRRQPRRPGRHAARLRAELGAGGGLQLRQRYRRPGRPDGAGDTVDQRVRGRRLRAAHHRRRDRARDRPGPGARQRLPHAAGGPRAGRP